MSDEEINDLDLLVMKGLYEEFYKNMGKFYEKTMESITSVILSSSRTVPEIVGLTTTINEMQSLAAGLQVSGESTHEKDKELLEMLSFMYQEDVIACTEDIRVIKRFVDHFTKRIQELTKLQTEGNEST
jgi:hypothetical protein